MRSKFPATLVMFTLAVIVVAFACATIWAQGREEGKKQLGPAPPGSKIVGEPPVEFSTLTDVNQTGAADIQQVLYTEPTVPNFGAGIPRDSQLDFNHPSYGTIQLDALAHPNDFLFQALLLNQSAVYLLVSFQGDPGANAVWREAPGGATSVLWTHNNLDLNGTALTPSRELDALEVWGPMGPGASDDAYQFSLEGDPGGVSVFNYNPAGGAITNFIPQSVIQSACVALGYNGSVTVDLDALMVDEIEPGDIGVWDDNDMIIFSIRNTLSGGGNWDGGEIVVLAFGGAPAFLVHGGHTWNTNYVVADAFGLTPATEEVDAIEGYVVPAPQLSMPTLTQWGLFILVALLVSSAVYLMLRKRRKGTVAA
jgi:hypothetical protein